MVDHMIPMEFIPATADPTIHLAVIPLLPLLFIGIAFALAALFPEKTEQFGPRANELKISTSTYGDHLARVYGRGKVAGAIIWVKNNKVDEVATTTVEKQKLFGLITVAETRITTYEYFVTFAVAFTRHEITSFGKIFIDGEQQADLAAFESHNLSVRQFKGTATQLPSDEIVSIEGEDSTPAYRGISYLLFEDFPLEEVGIRVPNVEAEVIVDADNLNQEYSLSNLNGNNFTPQNDYDPINGLMVNSWVGGFVTVWSAVSGTVLWQVDIQSRDGLSALSPQSCLLDGYGRLYCGEATDGDLLIYDALSSELLAVLPDAFPNNAWTVIPGLDEDEETGILHLYWYKQQSLMHMEIDPLFPDTFSVETVVSGTGIVSSNQVQGMATRKGDTVWLCGDPNSGDPRIWKISLQDAGDPFSPAPALTTYDLSSYTSTTIYGVMYCPLDDTLLWLDAVNNRIMKADPTTPTTVLDTLDLEGSISVDPHWVMSRRGVSPEGAFSIVTQGAPDRLYLIDAVTMEILEELTQADLGGGTSLQLKSDSYYDPRLNAVATYSPNLGEGVELHWLPRAAEGRIPIADIYSGEAALAGITMDVTGVTGDTYGYTVRDDTPPRGVLEDVGRVKQKEFAQIDGVLTAFDKAASPEDTIALEDTGASLGNSEKKEQIRVLERFADQQGVPKAVTLEYFVYDAKYRTGAQKITVPNESYDESGENLQFSTNMTLGDDEAAQSADVILEEARDVAITYETVVLPKYVELHAGSVVTLTLDDDREVNAVVDEISMDMAMELKLHRRQFDYATNAVGGVSTDTTIILPTLAQAQFLGLDIPILKDEHDDGGFYWALHTLIEGSFRSATVHRSGDSGVSFDFFASVNEEAIVLLANDALSPTALPWVTDPSDTIDAVLISGDAPSTVSVEALLNESNLFAVRASGGWEIVSIQTFTQVDDFRYTLSGFIRGRFGTENYIAGHSAGDFIVQVDPATLGTYVFQEDDIASKNVSYIYLPRTVGLPSNSANQTTFTQTAVSTRPYAPYPVEGSRDGSGNLDITWHRRTRLQHIWIETEDTAPLGEDTEEYEIDIYVSGGGLLRTVTGLATPSYQYTLANYQSDSGNGSATEVGAVDVQVFQISAAYGRGETIEVTL